MANTDSYSWLEQVLSKARKAPWCTKISCTTCGAMEFRRAFWEAAAEDAGTPVTFNRSLSYRDVLLYSVSDEIVSSLIKGLQSLPPYCSNSSGLWLIIADLEWLSCERDFHFRLDDWLVDGPAARVLARRRAYQAERMARYLAQTDFESPQEVEERKLKEAAARQDVHRLRKEESRQRSLKRMAMIDTLSKMPLADRYERIANDNSINIDCLPSEFISCLANHATELDQSLSRKLIKRIDRRKGELGKVRKLLEKNLAQSQ